MKGERVRDPIGDGDNILNFSEASERRSASGLTNASHIEGDGGVTMKSQRRSDTFEKTL